MPGRSRKDVERYTDLYWELYQTQLDLQARTRCPAGHLFSEGFIEAEGQVEAIKVNTRIDPDGQVTCCLCNNARARHYRQQIAEGVGVS